MDEVLEMMAGDEPIQVQLVDGPERPEKNVSTALAEMAEDLGVDDLAKRHDDYLAWEWNSQAEMENTLKRVEEAERPGGWKGFGDE